MKYLVLLLLFVSISVTSQAQHIHTLFAADTITNTEADTLNWTSNFNPGHYISCHCEYTELSGTSDVDQILEGSQDGGTQWFVIDTDTLVNGVNAAEIYQFSGYTSNNAKRYRVRLVGAGTQSLRYRCSLAVRRIN